MNPKQMMIDAKANKDFGLHARLGAYYASRGTHKQYLRKHRLGKFKKGK